MLISQLTVAIIVASVLSSAEEKPRTFEKLQFTFQTNGAIRGTPIQSDGKIYFGSGDGYLYCIDALSGGEEWKFDARSPMNSTPALSKGILYCTAKNGTLFAVDARTGKAQWSVSLGKELPYRNGFDYYVASPTIESGNIYVGSGDGNIYAISSASQKVLWKYFTGARVRSTPTVDGDALFVGNHNGFLFSLNKLTGKLIWKFETLGASLKIEDYGYDRSAILSSPTVKDGIVVFGCRDGLLYAVETSSGKLKWKFDHDISWAISKPLIIGSSVYTGTSDGHFVQSVNLQSGVEQWRLKTLSGVWASPTADESSIYYADFAGWIYGADIAKGTERWRFRTSAAVYASPLLVGNILYCGSDDGYLYAIRLNEPSSIPPKVVRKAVFWEPDSIGSWFRNGLSVFVRDFFVRSGYEQIDRQALRNIMLAQVNGQSNSVVVFAQNTMPKNLSGGFTRNALTRKYLDAGGTMVWLGAAPVAYFYNDTTGFVDSLDFSYAQSMLGIRYPGKSLEGLGLYSARPTTAGMQRGLRGWWVGFGWVDERDVTEVLARDEHGEASCWYKDYGKGRGAGLLQLSIPRDKPTDLLPIQNVIESYFR
jgi:outer membrane protein assembly factor BamB